MEEKTRMCARYEVDKEWSTGRRTSLIRRTGLKEEYFFRDEQLEASCRSLKAVNASFLASNNYAKSLRNC
jgi:hypothetical protein